MSKAVAARVLSEADHPRWNRLVADSAHGSVYSTTDYLDALSEATGAGFRVLGALKGDELVGGVALYERSSPLGPYVAPRFLLYYNGVVLRDSASKYPSESTARGHETLEALAGALDALGYRRLELRSRSTFTDARVLAERGWTVSPTYTYQVALADLEAQWRRVDQNLRRLVERCAARGVEITEDDDFDSYYRLHLQTHERKGAPLYLPLPAYRRFFERLRSQSLCRLYHARLAGGRAVASQLVLVGHPVTHTVSAASDADFLSLGVSPFLRWRVFEELARLGYAANDLTDASLGSVTRFKSQLGGSLELCLVAARPEPLSLRAARRVRRLARRLSGRKT